MNKRQQTKATLQRHLHAFGTGVVDTIMEDYAADAVFITPDGILRGKSAIRSLFDELVEALPPGSTIDIEHQFIEGDMAYLVWSGESDTLRIPFATDTLIVRDSVIVQQTFAAQMEPKTGG